MESIFTEVSSQNGHAGGIPNDSEIEVTSVSSMNGDHSGDTALEHGAVDLVSQEDMAIFNRLCQRFLELTKHLNREHNCLKGTHFKDYTRLPELKEVLRSTDAACREYGRCLAEVVSRLTEVRQALTSVSDVIDAKLTSEGVRSWIPESEPPEKDYTLIAEQKAIIARAAQARAAAGKAKCDVTSGVQIVAELEAEVAETSLLSDQAAQEAESEARRAEDAKKAAELKAKADEQARRRDYDLRKRKEAEERKQRQEEERRKREAQKNAVSEEERETMRLEQERKDPKNWPMSVYSTEPGDIDIPIGCVVRAQPGSFPRDSMDIEPLLQLDDVIQLSDHEELVSHIFDMMPTSGERKLQLAEPLAVAIPHCAPRNASRETVVKQRMPNGQWREIPSYDVVIEDIKEFKFVEVRLKELCPLVVVTRFKRETFVMTRKGGKISPSVEPRIVFSARPATFRASTQVTFEVQPLELSAVSDVKARNANLCEGLLSSSPVVAMLVAVITYGKAVTMSLPVPPPPTKAKRPGTAAPGPKSSENKDKKAGRTTTRPTSAFFAISNKEEEPEDVLHLVHWDPNTKLWVKQTDVCLTQSKNKDIATFEMAKYVKRLMVLRTKVGVTDQEVEKMAQLLESSLKQRAVQIILRQRSDDAFDAVLQCTNLSKSERFQRKLTEEGFGLGPLPSKEIITEEGKKMCIRFRGNIKEADDIQLDFVFNSHIRTRLDFSLVEIDRFAQKGINCYRGFVQVYTKGLVENIEPREEKPKTQNQPVLLVDGDVLLCELLVSLPKPEPEPPRPIEKAPVKIKSDGLIDDRLLRHLASEMGEEWRKLARCLNVRRVRLQAILRNNVNNEQENAIYDMLLTWAKKVPHSCNKVDVLCQALSLCGRPDLVEEIKDREADFKEERAQITRDSTLRKAFIKVAQNAHVTNDWKFLARQLGLGEQDLTDIEQSHPGMRDRCLQSLKVWGDRQGAMATSDQLIKELRRCRYHHVIAQLKTMLQ